jgi:hypothetical protein
LSKYQTYLSNFADHDLDPTYQKAEIAYQLLNISNELAEANRLKRMELEHFQIRHLGAKLTDKDFEDKA